MKVDQKLSRADYLSLALITFLVFAIYIPDIFSGLSALAMPLEHDIILQWIPFKEFTASSLGQGYIPLWTSNVFAGMPFLAFSHTGVMYPPGWLLLFDYPSAVNWFYPLHLIIAGWGMFFLLRTLRMAVFPSTMAALCMILTGNFFYFIHFLPSACSNPWSPWFFYFMIKIMRCGRLRHLLGMALVFALQILGGDVEGTSYQLLFSPLFLALLWWREGQGMKARRLIPLIASMAAGAVSAAAQLIPLLEYSQHFIRANGVTFEYFTSRTLSIELFWSLLYPVTRIEQIPHGPICIFLPRPYTYLGIITIAFSLIALIRGSRSSSRPLFLLAALALVYSFGSLPVLDSLIHHIPFLNKYGAPEHAFYLFQIFIAICASQGMDDVIQRLKTIPRPKSAARILVIAICLVFSMDTYARAFIYNDRNRTGLYDVKSGVKELVEMADEPGARFIAVSREGIRDIELTYHIGMRLDAEFIDGWITVPPMSYAKFMNKIDPRAASFDESGKLAELGLNVNLRDGLFISADSMPLLDLMSLRYIINRDISLKFASPYYMSPVSRVFIEKGSSLVFRNPDRVGTERDKNKALQVILREENKIHLLYQAKRGKGQTMVQGKPGYINISLNHWAGKEVEILFISDLKKHAQNSDHIVEGAMILNPNRPIQRISSNSIDLFENTEALPRAFLAHEIEVTENPEKLLEKLAGMDRFELQKKILVERQSPAQRILEKSIRERNINPERFKAIVRQTRHAPGLDVYEVKTVIPGMLFTSDQYLPGWRAEIDGKEFQILRADYSFRTVFVPEGEHTVRFFYDPASFHIGLWSSIATIIFIIMILAAYVSKNLKSDLRSEI
jgi:hypothetical protein